MTQQQETRPWLSVVIPTYNESARLGRSLAQLRRYASAAGRCVEVIVVDDGSADGTAEVARGLAEPDAMRLRVLSSPRNRGKGFCVRWGMLEAEGELLLMSDADMSTPIGEVGKLLPWLERGYAVAIGSRAMPDSELGVSRAPMRRVMQKIFRLVRRRMLLGDLHDTQCGFKLFRAEAAREVFARQRTEGFAFDCEVLALARRMGLRIKEVGVVWCDDPDSRLRPIRDSLRMILELVRIRWRLRHARTGPQAKT